MKGSGAGERGLRVGALGHWALCGSGAGEEVCSPGQGGGPRVVSGRLGSEGCPAGPREHGQGGLCEDFGRRWSGAGSQAERPAARRATGC